MELSILQSNLARSGYTVEVGDGSLALTDGAVTVAVDTATFLTALDNHEPGLINDTKTNPPDQTLRRWARRYGVSIGKGKAKRWYRDIQRDLLLVLEIADLVSRRAVA